MAKINGIPVTIYGYYQDADGVMWCECFLPTIGVRTFPYLASFIDVTPDNDMLSE